MKTWGAKLITVLLCMHAQLCLTFCDLVDCSPPGFSVHGIFQVRILEWVATPSSRGSSVQLGNHIPRHLPRNEVQMDVHIQSHTKLFMAPLFLITPSQEQLQYLSYNK